jgi:hypothetical protein
MAALPEPSKTESQAVIKTPETLASPAMRRILAVLEKKANMSVSDISAEAFVGMTTLACGGYMRTLKQRRLIFVSGWRKVKGRFSTPLYSRGDHPDVTRPRIDDTSRDAPGMDRIVAVLKRCGDLTYREIAQFSGLSLNTVKNSGFLDALIAQKRIHIVGWKHSNKGPMSPVYRNGPGAAAAKPKPLSGAEKSRRHRDRERIVANGDGLGAQIGALSAALQGRRGG